MASLKVGEVRCFVDKFADALEKNRADAAVVRGIRDLCAMFAANEDMTMTAFLKAIEHVPSPIDAQDSASVGGVIPTLSSLHMLVKDVAKKDLNQGLDSLLDALRMKADLPVSALVPNAVHSSKPKRKGKDNKCKSSKTKGKEGVAPVDDRLVDDYVGRLQAALGDDSKFEPLLEELRADERVAQPEAVAIASRFYGRTAKGTSRLKALERVRERQVKLMKFKRQSSTAGRSAA